MFSFLNSESNLFDKNPSTFWKMKISSTNDNSSCMNLDDGGSWPLPDVVMTFDGYITTEMKDTFTSLGLVEVSVNQTVQVSTQHVIH